MTLPVFREVHENKRAEWRFAFYAPGAQMASHHHDLAHFSVVLTGNQREASRGKEWETGGMWMGFKPRNFRHENLFGPNGALLLSINLKLAGEDDREIADDNWRVMPATGVRLEWLALASALCAETRNDDEINDLTDDILSVLRAGGDAPPTRLAPRWLLRARQLAVEEGASAGRIALDAGVHRVHLSRVYKAHFGVTLSEDRRRARLARAAKALAIEGIPASDVAHLAGFADQAHLTRELRRETGLTPRTLGRLF